MNRHDHLLRLLPQPCAEVRLLQLRRQRLGRSQVVPHHPGEFGARASKLYQLLRQGHYDVKLPPEDLHRLAVWLDSCSLFYGVYEKEGGEAQLQGEIAKPTLE